MPESQGSSLLSLLTATQQAGPTDSGISQVLLPRLGPEPRYLGGLGQAFEGRVSPSQPGHLEVRQALVRGATPQRTPTADCFLRSGFWGLAGQGSWDLGSGMQSWQPMRNLLRVICINSTLATSQVPGCRAPEVAHGDDPSASTHLSPPWCPALQPAYNGGGFPPTCPTLTPRHRQTDRHTPSPPGNSVTVLR